MKVVSSLKSLKKRDLNSKLVKRRGKLYVINKKIQNLRQDKVKTSMEIEDQKKTWRGFIKLVIWVTAIIIIILSILGITLL